jgi:phosphoserine phosphatase
MKKYILLLGLIIGSLTLVTGCSDSVSLPAKQKASTEKLSRLNWSERNYLLLNQLISDYGSEGKYYDPSRPPYAVLDWDQTCAHFDTEEALMRYQISNLCYKMTKQQFRDLLKDEINGVKQLPADFQKIMLKDINEDLTNDYDFIYEHYSGLAGSMSLDEIRQTNQYKDFRAKLPFLYDGYCGTEGIGASYAYPWLLFLLTGYTIDEIRDIAKSAISYELSNNLSRQEWISPEDFHTKAGVTKYSYKTGLRIFPEMQNLISTFRANGIDVFIVSASYKPVIEVFSGIGNFGYNIPGDHVIAMELATSDDGKILAEYKKDWVQTQGAGKVEAINRVIKSGLGRNWSPIFSAGDSDGDYEMLTMFPDMKLSLIWNRVKGGNIGKLCRQAAEEMLSTAPRYILQGRNENTGIVLPCSESILFGKTELQLLP